MLGSPWSLTAPGVVILATPEHLHSIEELMADTVDMKRYKERGQLLCFDAVEFLRRIMAGKMVVRAVPCSLLTHSFILA